MVAAMYERPESSYELVNYEDVIGVADSVA